MLGSIGMGSNNMCWMWEGFSFRERVAQDGPGGLGAVRMSADAK